MNLFKLIYSTLNSIPTKGAAPAKQRQPETKNLCGIFALWFSTFRYFFSFSLLCSCFYLHCSRSRITDCLMMFLRWYIEWLYINASVKSLYIYMNTNSHYYYHVKRNNMLHCIHNIHTKISDVFSQWIAQSKIISKMIEEKSMFSAKRFM